MNDRKACKEPEKQDKADQKEDGEINQNILRVQHGLDNQKIGKSIKS